MIQPYMVQVISHSIYIAKKETQNMCPTCCMQKSSLLWVWSQFLSWIVRHVHGLSWGPGFRGKAARLIKRGWTGGGTWSRHSTIPVGSQTMEGVIGYEVLVAKHLLVFTSKLNSSKFLSKKRTTRAVNKLHWDTTMGLHRHVAEWLHHALETRYPLIWLLKGFLSEMYTFLFRRVQILWSLLQRGCIQSSTE